MHQRNEEFFRAGEVSGNKGHLINISSPTYERKAPQGRILEFFLLDNYNSILNEKFNPQINTIILPSLLVAPLIC